MGGVYNSLNLATYTYAGNNPINYIDPTGRSVWGKLIKLIVKGGDVGATTAGLVEDYDTLTSGKSSGWAKAGAAVSMGSELLPVSVGDVKDAYGAGKRLYKWVKGTDKAKDKAARGTAGGKRAGMDFTQKGKREVRDKNRASHDGKLTCENCGRDDLVEPQRARGGQPRPDNEGQVDHIIPKAKRGDGSPSNGQVLCPQCNANKGSK
jgi:hypothetical protein